MATRLLNMQAPAPTRPSLPRCQETGESIAALHHPIAQSVATTNTNNNTNTLPCHPDGTGAQQFHEKWVKRCIPDVRRVVSPIPIRYSPVPHNQKPRLQLYQHPASQPPAVSPHHLMRRNSLAAFRPCDMVPNGDGDETKMFFEAEEELKNIAQRLCLRKRKGIRASATDHRKTKGSKRGSQKQQQQHSLQRVGSGLQQSSREEEQPERATLGFAPRKQPRSAMIDSPLRSSRLRDIVRPASTPCGSVSNTHEQCCGASEWSDNTTPPLTATSPDGTMIAKHEDTATEEEEMCNELANVFQQQAEQEDSDFESVSMEQDESDNDDDDDDNDDDLAGYLSLDKHRFPLATPPSRASNPVIRDKEFVSFLPPPVAPARYQVDGTDGVFVARHQRQDSYGRIAGLPATWDDRWSGSMTTSGTGNYYYYDGNNKNNNTNSGHLHQYYNEDKEEFRKHSLADALSLSSTIPRAHFPN
eukprot:TRINITY_DN9407_c0_g1_i1.p1 TRINITY_DN9407_c0_g1~~TRINITY_DN9407_c0_g1_i1.p1  ORF type:complete len:472 (-),score=105.00 TRINITY_DN9407_c0_g1_i1:307-1722(-)